jgi:apolipoprotein N-acyltransferase
LTAFALLLTQASRSLRSAALLAGSFGIGNFLTGLSWVYISMHLYGGMPALLAGVAVVMLAVGMAAYLALGGALWWQISRDSFNSGFNSGFNNTAKPRCSPCSFTGSWSSSLLLASIWTLANWLRGTLFTGFPWLATGYPQADGPLRGYAALFGVYGVGWLTVFIATLLARSLIPIARLALRVQQPSAPPLSWHTVGLTVAAIAALLWGGSATTHIGWTQPYGTPLTVRLLQGNVPQHMKFSDAGKTAALQRYEHLITAQPADLIVTPETALPMLASQIPLEWYMRVQQFIDRTGSALLFGAVGVTTRTVGNETYDSDFTNSLYGIVPTSVRQTVYRYDKHHLVPFGEFIPWGFHWFIAQMHIPLGDLLRGAPVQPPFAVRDQSLAPNICYEDLFGEEIAHTLREQSQLSEHALPSPTHHSLATILVNASNLAWFGNTIALPQALQVAQMRALETGRPMLIAANTGPTAMLDAEGRIQGQLPVYTLGALALTVQGRSGLTPYIRFGNAPVLWLSFILLGWRWLYGAQRRL